MKLLIFTLVCGVAYVVTLALGHPQTILAAACFISMIAMVVQTANQHKTDP